MKSGETVLVTAAAGGTGQFAVQVTSYLLLNHIIGVIYTLSVSSSATCGLFDTILKICMLGLRCDLFGLCSWPRLPETKWWPHAVDQTRQLCSGT